MAAADILPSRGLHKPTPTMGRSETLRPRAAIFMHLFRHMALALGLIGCALFGLAFAVSIANPGLVEKTAKSVIRYEVEKKVREKIDAIDGGFLAKKAGGLSKGYAEEIAQTQRLLAQNLPAQLARVIAEMQDLDCACRNKVETHIRTGMEWRIASAAAAQERLALLIRTQYMETADQLIREFRIFTGTNALVFAFLFVAVVLKRQAGIHFLPASIVLLASAGMTAYLYLFSQDWLHTLVFSDYVGLSYVAYLGGAFTLLSDIAFNRARVTTEVLSAALNAVGSGVQILPC